MDWDAFFTVHKDLPREGPGTPDDVAWAVALADVPKDAVICDIGAGPGGDVAALLSAAPGGRVVAVDMHFADTIAARFADQPRVRAVKADMAEAARFEDAPFDMIWSAGALYFLGLDLAVETMRSALYPGGVLAFSEPCKFVDTPSDRASAFFEDYPLRTAEDIADKVAKAGFDVLGQRKISDAGWEDYYQPIEARIGALRPDADAKLTKMLDACAQEVVNWRAVRDEVGYVLTVARRLT